MLAISEVLLEMGMVPRVIICIACMLFGGFLLSRITKLLRLPNVTAYIIAGILLGPFCFNIIPSSVIEGTDFLSDIAVAFIAFTTGEFFKINTLRNNGKKAIIVAIFESVITAILVFVLTYFILKLDINLSIVISSLSMATAPTSIMMNIRQTNSKGDFVNSLLQVVAIDDLIGLVGFSIAISIASANLTNNVDFKSVITPVLLNILVIVIGGLFGVVLKLLMPERRSNDNKLIVGIALLFVFCGICALLDISPLLGCMSMGMVYINISNDDKFFKQIRYFSPPFLLLFFVRSGLNLRLDSMFSKSSIGILPIIVIGLLIFVIRDIGKYAGSYLGCKIVRKEKRITNYLGLSLFSQASVSIGLAAIASRTFLESGSSLGPILETIIVIVSILNEFVGPGLSKLSLYLSKSYSNNIDEVSNIDNKENEVNKLIAQIEEIQKGIEKHPETSDEDAFLEASMELYNYNNYRNRFINRRKK